MRRLLIAMLLMNPGPAAADLAVPSGNPEYRRPAPGTTREDPRELPDEETRYFRDVPARYRWVRGLERVQPESDGIGAWAPPVELGLAFLVGAGRVVEIILVEWPSRLLGD